jgi:ABC-type lipoprotein export system ATPase subunit
MVRMAEPLVICDNLVKIYKVESLEVVALQGLDLEVAAGEMLAVVGASGSGKTTLMNVLGALDLPSAGRCVVAGYDLAHLSEEQHTIYRRTVVGHIWQHSGRNLLPDLSVSANIGLPMTLAGIPGNERARRVRDLLGMVGLRDHANNVPRQLSGGEQQRAAIATALANAPQLLLADEPTGDLDSATAHEIFALLRRLNRDLGLTVIIVTHDASIAAEADRTIAIRDGRTSTETVRRDLPLMAGSGAVRASAVIGLPGTTHREAVVIDRVGRLQLPHEALERLPFDGRAEVRILGDHVEVWPVRDEFEATQPRGLRQEER